MVVVIVHLTQRSFSGSKKPPSKRIALPSSQQFLDRNIVYSFIGLPTNDIDTNSESLDSGQTCGIDAIRQLTLVDDLDTGKNTWDRVMGTLPGISSHCPFKERQRTCTKKEFVRGVYLNYTTKDGDPAYPAEMIDFAGLWHMADGRWSDDAENFLAWEHYGSHRIEAVPAGSREAAGGAAFRIVTSDLGSLDVRPGFSRVGADMFFNGAGEPTMIRTPDGQDVWRAKAESATWQYWKFVFRSSLFLKVTLVDHLWATHFTAANSMAAAARESLSPTHPLRRLLTMFTFNTIQVNSNAFHQLLGPDALLQRSTPFYDFREVSLLAEVAITPLTKSFGFFLDETVRSAMPARVQETPYAQDGQLIFDALQDFVASWFDLYGGRWCSGGAVSDPAMLLFFERVQAWSMYQQHAEVDASFLGLRDGDGGLQCAGLQKWLTMLFFQVTGYHRHVGTVADSAADPDFAGFSWAEGRAYTPPRQAIQLSLISATTSTVWPKLNQDYTHLAQGIEKSAEAVQIFQTFRVKLEDIAKTIDARNKERPIPYMQMHPDHVECSVAV
ncbi:unnamed protein product [Prorocentrum cordatum]|uniref:Lipoxygenase domain-containing protein n=1 Tax=Prorocentrum cordatum TaxID=2364126 RepID=A0ABN9SN29_9DINO|nr:unnamed protein product [Polarella glacialis]